MPRVIYGVPGSWNQPPTIDGGYKAYTWSPCGQFISAWASTSVNIWDALTLKKYSSLQLSKPAPEVQKSPDILAYSPDGHSLAGCFGSTITIWDIQTGGVAKDVECFRGGIEPMVLVWSPDGTKIGVIFKAGGGTWVVDVYDVASGTKALSGTFLSSSAPHLWPHEDSLWIMTILSDGTGAIIRTFAVWPILSDDFIESFFIELNLRDALLMSTSFSPSTYQISAITHQHSDLYTLLVFDIQNSKTLIMEEGFYRAHCFSPCGDLLVAFEISGIQIWKYTSNGHYTRWRDCQYWKGLDATIRNSQISPTSSSILIPSETLLEVLHLTDPPSQEPKYCCNFSANGILVATAPCYYDEGIVTITNLHKNSSESINTEFEIEGLALTGNILLVKVWREHGLIVAWRLTTEGTVDGTLGIRGADYSNSLWTKPLQGDDVKFWVEGYIGVITDSEGSFVYYNTETGEELESVLVAIPPPSSHSWKYFHDQEPEEFGAQFGIHNFIKYHDPSDNPPMFIPWYKEGWIMYPRREHQHWFWLPPHWRSWYVAQWVDSVASLRLYNTNYKAVIKF